MFASFFPPFLDGGSVALEEKNKKIFPLT